jgi:hypothetical protein
LSAEERSPAWATKLQHDLRAGLREDLVLMLRQFTDAQRNATLVPIDSRWLIRQC